MIESDELWYLLISSKKKRVKEH